MGSPLDLASVRFDKAPFGYRADDVDDYVDEVGKTITALVEENKELQEKLEILAAKVEEYKEDEESLRSAVLGAQKLGDSIIRDSKNKAEVLLRDATIRSERMIEATHKKVEQEQQALARIHKEVSDFKNHLISMYKAHIELITALPEQEDKRTHQEPPAPAAAEPPVPAQPEPEQTELSYEEAPPSAPPEVMMTGEEIIEEHYATGDAPPAPERREPAPGPAPKGEGQTPYQRYTSKYGTLLFGDDIDVR